MYQHRKFRESYRQRSRVQKQREREREREREDGREDRKRKGKKKQGKRGVGEEERGKKDTLLLRSVELEYFMIPHHGSVVKKIVSSMQQVFEKEKKKR